MVQRGIHRYADTQLLGPILLDGLFLMSRKETISRSAIPPAEAGGLFKSNLQTATAFKNPPSGSWGMVQVPPSSWACKALIEVEDLMSANDCTGKPSMLRLSQPMQVGLEQSPSFRWGGRESRFPCVGWT